MGPESLSTLLVVAQLEAAARCTIPAPKFHPESLP